MCVSVHSFGPTKITASPAPILRELTNAGQCCVTMSSTGFHPHVKNTDKFIFDHSVKHGADFRETYPCWTIFLEGKYIEFIVNATPDARQQTAVGRVDGRGLH